MTCSQRQASACTSSQGMPSTSTSMHSASRCLRITRVAVSRPVGVSSRCRSPLTTTRPSRSMRATVCDTVGPLWLSRSAMRARIGTMPSSSSSKMVRRYISVVSIRSPTRPPATSFHFGLPTLNLLPSLQACRPSCGSVETCGWPTTRPCWRRWTPRGRTATAGSCRSSSSTPRSGCRRARSGSPTSTSRCSPWLPAWATLQLQHGDPAEVLPEVVQATGATSVHIAADFGPYGSDP